MKKTFLFPLILFYLCSFSQTPEEFLKNQCEHFTDGKGATYGIKMKLNIPCTWDSTKDSRTYLVNGFSYDVPDSGRLACAVTITKPNPNNKKEDEKNIFKKEWVGNAFKTIGDLISVKEVDIDAHKWAEYTFMKSINAPQGEIHQIAVSYYIIYKGVGIMVAYKTMSTDITIGALLFITYVEMFKTLASSIHIYNFWQ